jgi:tight adherence protein C
VTPITVPIDLSALRAPVILLPLAFGLGAYLLLTAQPLGRPRPDLREMLRRLDVDERIRDELAHEDVKPLFASRVLEQLLRPVMDDLGQLLRSLFARLGLGNGQELERKLRLVRPGIGPVQFFGEKIGSGLVGVACFPIMNAVGIHPFGVWPLWVWGLGLAVGFLAPDWQLERALEERRTRCLMELPALMGMLTIAASAGLALEEALDRVAAQSAGTIAQELQRATREAALGQRPLIEALEAMAERNGIPELSALVSQLRASHEQGIGLVQALSAEEEALRERKRLEITESGSKATVKMILPVALFIFPVLYVVVLVPAGVELLHLTG